MQDAIQIIKINVRDCLTHPSSTVRSYALALMQEVSCKPKEFSRACVTIADCYQYSGEDIKSLCEQLFQALVECQESADPENGSAVKGAPPWPAPAS